MNYFPPKFVVRVFMLLAAFNVEAQGGFLCTPSTVSPYGLEIAAYKCPEAPKFELLMKRCDKFLIPKDIAKQEQDKYYWILQDDDIAKQTMILNRYDAKFILKLAYASSLKSGFTIQGVCEAAQMPKPKL